MSESTAVIKKVILCNRSALLRKYGRYAEEIEKTVDFIILLEEERGISSCLIMLDNNEQMKRYHGTAVKDCSDREQNKKAVDAIVKYFRPDLITIWGGPDIIPHQILNSPEKGGEDIPTDLPYACDSKYGTKLSSFLKPVRKVTRLPDVSCEADGTLANQRDAANHLRSMLVDFSLFTGYEKARLKDYAEIEKTLSPPMNKVKLQKESLVINICPYGARLTNDSGRVPPANSCLFNGAAAYLSVTDGAEPNEYDNRLVDCFKEELKNGEMLGTAFYKALTGIAGDAKKNETAGKVMAHWILLGDSSYRPVKKS